MWEKFIRRLGFKNIYQGGQIIGFQFKIHIPYYRGVFLSCLSDAFEVKIDGESISLDSVSIKVGDRIIPWSQIDAAYDVFWAFGTLATVIVNKPGGLIPGLHTVGCGLSIRKSYVPKYDPEGVYDFANLPRSENEPRKPVTGMEQQNPPQQGGYVSSDPMFQLQKCSLDMTLVM